MTDGYWINWQTGKTLEMPVGGDHEVFIRQPKNAQALSVPDEVFQQFRKYEIGECHDRHKLLIWLFKAAPLIRVRGHGNYTTFNYSAKSNRKPYEAIQKFVKRVCGEVMMLEIVNFYGAKPRGERVFPCQFDALIKKQQRKRRLA